MTTAARRKHCQGRRHVARVVGQPEYTLQLKKLIVTHSHLWHVQPLATRKQHYTPRTAVRPQAAACTSLPCRVGTAPGVHGELERVTNAPTRCDQRVPPGSSRQRRAALCVGLGVTAPAQARSQVKPTPGCSVPPYPAPPRGLYAVAPAPTAPTGELLARLRTYLALRRRPAPTLVAGARICPSDRATAPTHTV